MGRVLHVPLVIGLACGLLADPSAGQERRAWLEVTAPQAERSSTSLPLIEVKGRAGGRRMRGHDLVIVLDLSDSTVRSSGVDLDGDGVGGRTDPELLSWFAGQPGVREALVERLREGDLDDSILMAEISAAEVLIERLNPRVFHIGIVVFSDTARIVAPLGSPRGRLIKALRELRRGFFRDLRGTNFCDAVEVAHTELVPDLGEPGDARASREDRERSILFLSDGAPTLPVYGDRAKVYSLAAARAAAADGIRIYSFALGRETEEVLDVYRKMAILSGGQFEKLDRPADAIARLRRLDLADLKEVRVVNRTTGGDVRALRVFPDGSFDGFVELAPGKNRLVFAATTRDGAKALVARDVDFQPQPGESGDGARGDREQIQALLDELRRRTRETALWAELEQGRKAQRLELQIQPEPPESVPRE